MDQWSRGFHLHAFLKRGSCSCYIRELTTVVNVDFVNKVLFYSVVRLEIFESFGDVFDELFVD